jgi:peptidoglycan hydrolase-like protein with peptidoglycan-binding domain
MTFSLIWMPSVLLKAGLKVALTKDWETRGRGEMGTIRGILCHHTAGPRHHNMPSLDLLIEGRHDVRGPLAQLGLGRDGTFYVIAAGRANHAGAGSWRGVTAGSGSFIGIEAENTGVANDQPWPEVQLNAYRRGVAALLGHLGLPPEACAGHKEYALPRGRKIDPSFDMNRFRADVAAIMLGSVPTPPLIPAAEPPAAGHEPRPTLRRGSTGAFVSKLRTRLGLLGDGAFDGVTEATVRQFQRQHDLVPDGIVGPKTWAKLDTVVAPSA